MADRGLSKKPRAERPTLKTISRLSGLAVTTVSRALGDAPDIGKETKEKVRRIANEIGYVPNRAGVRLRTGRTNVIALVLPTENEVLNMTPRLIASIAGALDGTSYHLIVVPELPTQDPMDPVRYIVETKSADAIILNRVAPEDARVSYLLDAGVPFVTHGRTVWSGKHAYVDFDNRAFAELAIEALAARGRRSCILIAPPQDQNYGRDFVAGATGAAKAKGMALTILDATSDDLRDDIAEAVTACLEATPQADALVSASPHAAMAAVGAVERGGHRLGETFDVFAKETFPILGLFREEILTISEDIEAAGRFLARAAIDEIRHPKGAPMQHLDIPVMG